MSRRLITVPLPSQTAQSSHPTPRHAGQVCVFLRGAAGEGVSPEERLDSFVFLLELLLSEDSAQFGQGMTLLPEQVLQRREPFPLQDLHSVRPLPPQKQVVCPVPEQ